MFPLALLLLLLQIHVLRYAYMRLGVSSAARMALLFGSLLGSAINIPIAQLGPEPFGPQRRSAFFRHALYRAAVARPAGASWGASMSAARLFPRRCGFICCPNARSGATGFFVTAIMAAICHALAEPVAGVGIALPTFAPPIAAALVAAVASWRELAALAYVGGSLGVLIGADLTNLDKIRGLGAPVASIGGAGTFDGIFVTGVFAVLLAGFARGGESSEQPRRHGAS